jgi:raffinose/stachyose/melibiose transport system substrate-binding protein
MNYSSHQKEAAAFLEFLTTQQAADIINAAGLIPDITGTTTTNPVNQQMLGFAENQGFTRYPMLDNVTQGNVVDTGNKTLPSILAGKTSAQSGLDQMNTTWQQLPAAQRGQTYN